VEATEKNPGTRVVVHEDPKPEGAVVLAKPDGGAK
jgi:hypothetical protein